MPLSLPTAHVEAAAPASSGIHERLYSMHAKKLDKLSVQRQTSLSSVHIESALTLRERAQLDHRRDFGSPRATATFGTAPRFNDRTPTRPEPGSRSPRAMSAAEAATAAAASPPRKAQSPSGTHASGVRASSPSLSYGSSTTVAYTAVSHASADEGFVRSGDGWVAESDLAAAAPLASPPSPGGPTADGMRAPRTPRSPRSPGSPPRSPRSPAQQPAGSPPRTSPSKPAGGAAPPSPNRTISHAPHLSSRSGLSLATTRAAADQGVGPGAYSRPSDFAEPRSLNAGSWARDGRPRFALPEHVALERVGPSPLHYNPSRSFCSSRPSSARP